MTNSQGKTESPKSVADDLWSKPDETINEKINVASPFPRATVTRPLPWGFCQRRSFRELYDRYFDWLCPLHRSAMRCGCSTLIAPCKQRESAARDDDDDSLLKQRAATRHEERPP